MLLETLLPLGKVDPGLRAPEISLDLASIGRNARLLEEIGYDGMVVEETKDDPFIIMALAAEATTKLKIATSVAIAFPRSPTVTAMSAWTLQKLSRGRFTLGLGTQVKAHIERRFGVPASPAGPWIREYIGAVRAVWNCWQNGAKLDVKGPHYNINLMVPLFNPGPIEQLRVGVMSIVNTLDAVLSSKSNVSFQHMGGPVMMMNAYYTILSGPEGIRMAIWFSVILNVNLALLNLLPLPVLDGGHITLALVEMVRRRPVSGKILNYVQSGFAIALIAFMVFIAFFDTGDWVRSARRDREQPIVFAPKNR